MYIPKLHEETDLSVLHALVRAHPLGTWATQGDGELLVNHVPFLLDANRGPYGTLMCHVARANPVWQQYSRRVPSVVAFQGPDIYISPSWYASKQLHGKVVPTWNYAVVHAHGIPIVLEDPDQLIAHVTQLTAAHEAGRPAPWKVSDAPREFIEQMARQVVGIEIPLAQIFGKWKVSQNRSPADRQGVESNLRAQGDPRSGAMADLVAQAARTDAGQRGSS
jgi:transcriptional regulator